MNSFRKFLLNPNVHLWSSLLIGIASFIPQAAPIAAILQTVSGTLIATGALLPEKGSLHAADYAKLLMAAGTAVGTSVPVDAVTTPVVVPIGTAIPAAVAPVPGTAPVPLVLPAGSLHANDYANIAAVLLQALSTVKPSRA